MVFWSIQYNDEHIKKSGVVNEFVFELEGQKVEFDGCFPFISMANCVFFKWKNVLFVALLSQKRARFGIFFITDSESAHFKSPYIKFWGGFDRKFYHDPNPLTVNVKLESTEILEIRFFCLCLCDSCHKQMLSESLNTPWSMFSDLVCFRGLQVVSPNLNHF